jgi:N-acetylmuramoyl-L-alanine amidase
MRKLGRMMKDHAPARCGRGLVCALALWFLAPGPANDCEPAYQKIKAEYLRLQDGPGLALADSRRLQAEFRAFADHNPACARAADALYLAGMIGGRAYQQGGGREDLERALAAFQTLAAKYPGSRLADDALYHSGEIHLALSEREKARAAFGAAALVPGGDMAGMARERLAEMPPPDPKPAAAPATTAAQVPPAPAAGDSLATALSASDPTAGLVCPAPAAAAPSPSPPAPAGANARFLGIRYWSNKEYTRVVVELDREVPYDPPHLLKPDPTLKTPPRLYIDFRGAVMPPGSANNDGGVEPGCYTLPIGDGLLKKARAGPFQPGVARVVLDIERIDHFRAFALPGEPFRYVIDVYGSPSGKAASPRTPAPPPSPGGTVEARAPRPGPRPRKLIVVLDPGHGGKDPGAIGPTGLREKDITLAIAKRVKRILETRRPDLAVVLTRADDRYYGLVERTAMANTLDADLFISIHCNAAPNREARGVETYYLDNTTDRASLKLAAKENFVSEEVMTDARDTTNLILADLITSSKVEDSVPLARSVQRSMIAVLRKKFSDVPDHGVKKAPFWVLTGAIMPCVLVETSFISNRKEEKRLRSPEYQQAAAEAIAAGIIAYLDSYPQITRGE